MVDQAKIEAVNKRLLAGEPGNISVDEHSGYTGYKPQAVIDAMNAELWNEWGFEELESEIIPGEKGGLVVTKVKVWLKGNDFQPTGWGQNRVTRGDIGDARKGGQTDAIKKALSYFSIGNRAYHGLLPDGKSKPGQRTNTASTNQPTNRATNPTPINKTDPEANNKKLEDIPSARQLFAEIDEGKVIGKSGSTYSRRDVLALVFRKDIDESHGAISIDALMELGTELSPEYCQRLDTFLERFRKSRAA